MSAKSLNGVRARRAECLLATELWGVIEKHFDKNKKVWNIFNLISVLNEMTSRTLKNYKI